MEIVLYVIESILLAILCFAIFLFFIVGLKLLVWFQFRTCQHCGNTLRYLGLKEGGSESYYLFHCEHCDAWEQIPMNKFVQDIDKDCNPNIV